MDQRPERRSGSSRAVDQARSARSRAVKQRSSSCCWMGSTKLWRIGGRNLPDTENPGKRNWETEKNYGNLKICENGSDDCLGETLGCVGEGRSFRFWSMMGSHKWEKKEQSSQIVQGEQKQPTSLRDFDHPEIIQQKYPKVATPWHAVYPNAKPTESGGPRVRPGPGKTEWDLLQTPCAQQGASSLEFVWVRSTNWLGWMKSIGSILSQLWRLGTLNTIKSKKTATPTRSGKWLCWSRAGSTAFQIERSRTCSLAKHSKISETSKTRSARQYRTWDIP